MGFWRLNKDTIYEVENVGDLRRALENIPDDMRIETGADNSADEPFSCGIYVNDDDEDKYFGISP